MRKSITITETVALVKQHGSINHAAVASGLGRTTLQTRFKQAVDAGMATWEDAGKAGPPTNEEVKQVPVAGRLKARRTPKARKGARTYILTCAQNNTHLHSALWQNILAFADYTDAEILVARTVYNRFADAASMDKKLIIERGKGTGRRTYEWDDALTEYLHDERLELAPGLVWCGELNVIPTAASPLSGYEGYTGRSSTVVPHPRIAMRSVASHKQENTKLMFTTGTVTMRNYIQRKAGQLADFHHCYGALLVEVDDEGTWFCRQLNADSEGTFYDLDAKVENGEVTEGHRLEAITWGDIHVAYGDPVTYELAWGEGGILDTLAPEKQFIHDLLDFRARNPHNPERGLSHQAFLEWVKGHVCVGTEVAETARFLAKTTRDFCETIVVDSNHDNFLVKWLYKTGDFRKDPDNAVYFLSAAHYLWSEMSETSEMPNMTEWAIQQELDELEDIATGLVTFLGDDESHVICSDAHGGIECGLHGHEGINGARPSPIGFSKTGRKANIGHHHTAGIYDGLYVAGIMGSLDQGYNSGLGSWSQSNILTYQNGKRAISTIFKGKWRA